jgi:hypothetical protein
VEDYHAAFLRCAQDVEALHEQKRRIAAMHFGGVAIECLLKYMLIASLRKDAIKAWYDGTDETKEYGHTITNPGHDYREALKRHNKLRSHIEKNIVYMGGYSILRSQMIITLICVTRTGNLKKRSTESGCGNIKSLLIGYRQRVCKL